MAIAKNISHMESYLGESTAPSAPRGLFSVALRVHRTSLGTKSLPGPSIE